MDPVLVKGFAIGFLVVAAGAGAYGWRQGWLPAPADLPGVSIVSKSPDSAPKPDPKPAPPPAASAQQSPKPAPGKAPGELAAVEPLVKPSPDATPAPPQAAPKAPAPGSDPAKGAFDIVRVEPSGEMVVAGRCAANCTVALTTDGRTHETVKADPAGNWAMTPPALPPGDHQLGLVVTTPDGKTTTSEQSVTVSVPKAPAKDVVVVLNEPNAPSKVLQRPGQPPAAAPRADETVAAKAPSSETPEAKTPAQKLTAASIVAVDAEKGRLFIQGTAPSGATLRVYLNNTLLAEPVAGGDERWSVRVDKGLTPGDYAARVDHVEKPSGKVIARAEARFSYEGEMAAAAPAPTPAAPEPKPASAAEPAAAQAPSDGVTTMFGGGAAWNAGATAQQPDAASPSAQAAAEPPKSQATDAPSAAQPATADVQDTGRTSYFGDASSQSQAAASQPQPEPTPGPNADPANLVVASIETAKVVRGDSLWRISRKTYGKGMRYTVIFSANDSQIRDPDLIYPGQVLVLPSDAAAGGTVTR